MISILSVLTGSTIDIKTLSRFMIATVLYLSVSIACKPLLLKLWRILSSRGKVRDAHVDGHYERYYSWTLVRILMSLLGERPRIMKPVNKFRTLYLVPD